MTELIPFTKTQTRLLNELKRKYEQGWLQELNTSLVIIYEELGLSEKAVDSKYRLELQPGFTGVNVTNTEPALKIPTKEPGGA